MNPQLCHDEASRGMSSAGTTRGPSRYRVFLSQVRRGWERLVEWHTNLTGGVRHQVTRSGIVFSFVILLVGLAAFASANNLLFLLLALFISTFLVSGFISRLGLAGLELDFQFPEHITANRKVTGRLILRNRKHWMASFSVHLESSAGSKLQSALYFPVVPGGAQLEEPVEAVFATRGLHKGNRFQFSTRFPFGFTERRVHVMLTREVLVYPSIEPQPGFEELLLELDGELESLERGRGSDFYRIRPYEATESARHVDWKATAHTGDLQVREFAREQEHLVEVFLDLAVADSERDWFERAIDCCAFLCWRLSARGARFRFATQNFDLRVPEDGDIYIILKYLALVQPFRSRTIVCPQEERSVQIAFTTNEEKLSAMGWQRARHVGSGGLRPDASPDSAPTGLPWPTRER